MKLVIFTSLLCSDGKEITKKRDERAKLFCQSKPVAFLPFSLTLPSSLFKLPILVNCKTVHLLVVL